ncbi:hypothetical protein HYH38_08250 [Clostridium botulinum]|uniref:SGNH/GDSL hydrolase family protein n=1 Tax=Clostridium botulinum TaxID=1491 RepID=UPI001C9B328D|nr:SGNH/GDSL hydrolase family protein [Clostridium botulinum]MBY6816475.1 hypothetical protein [Clostridium botulinum]MBY6827270.1 hypothetical protein [Clostridium botulinum]MBY6859218.1 hypothetical protein [Clostridium botulinum]MBY7041498.1 hypothetical protein [Clostridium botulinum]
MNIQELQTERLDINNKYNVELVCKQLDDVILKIIVYDKNLPADLSNYNVRLKAFKVDQVPIIQNTNIIIKDNIVTIKADKQLTTTEGIVKAELQFINKTTLEKKSTFYLEIEVVASVLAVDGTVSIPTCTLLEELDNKLDEIENIGNVLEEAKVVRDDLGLKIPIGTTLKNDLNTNIKTGTQLKTDLIELIPKVEKSKSDLDTSKINADLSNTTLLETTNNAETKKQEVVAECKVADEKIKQMNEFGDVTEVVKDVTLLKTEITTARDNETDLNTRLERDRTNILNKFNELDNQDVFKIIKDIKNKKIKILGDSIGAGVGGTGYSATGEIIVGNNKSNETGHCWANSFRDYLQSKYNCIVKNWSVSGWKSSDIVTNISTLITETDDIIICAIGANNCYIENGITLLESDIKTINEYCENHNKKVIFIGTIQTLTSSHENKGIKMEDIDNLLREVTTNLNVCFIPMYKLFNDYLLYSGADLSLFYYNEEHPNDNGYDAMFYLIANYMGFYTDLELRNKLYSLYDTGWLPLPLINGTVANTIDIPSYRRVGRMLSLKGEIDNIISTVTTVATLPSGFTPNSKFGGSSIALSFFWTGADTQSRMFINKNGNIIVPNHTDTKKMWLDGINFMID